MSLYLQRKIEELNEQIRTYPGPIARCDQHLPAVLEERARLLTRLEHQACSAEARWTNEGGFNAA